MEKKPSYEFITSHFSQSTFFAGKSWKYSPEPFPVSESILSELHNIGDACLAFYRALETLILKASEEKSILRNDTLFAPWVLDYLNRGKPDPLFGYSLSKSLRSMLPPVIRPDLLLTENGFVLSELDSVPGGIGLTAFLNRIYRETPGLIGKEDAIIRYFSESLLWNTRKSKKERDQLVFAIAVSEEASDYRPEMEFLAKELTSLGLNCIIASTNDIQLGEEYLYVVQNEKRIEIDLLYRFWELFDYKKIPFMQEIWERDIPVKTVITPPMKSFFEEKSALALFHHPRLKAFWKESLSSKDWARLQQLIPPTWIVDNSPLPPNALLWGPQKTDGSMMTDWQDLKALGRKERDFIIKISGFDETAWGARSVTVGDDVSVEEWHKTVDSALSSKGSYYVLQPFCKSKRIIHPLYNPDGSIVPMDGRIRLCPYYFVSGDKCQLGGALTTICPADKKIIHGMTDAILVPIALASSSQ